MQPSSPSTAEMDRLVVLNGIQSVGEQHGHIIVNAGEVVFRNDLNLSVEALRSALDRVEADQSLRALRSYLSAVRSFSSAPYVHLPLPNGLSLSDVYVSAVLKNPAVDMDNASIRSVDADLDSLLRDSTSPASALRILIEGGPGSGKSTLLRITASSESILGAQGSAARWIPMPLRMQAIAQARGASIGERLWNALGITRELLVDAEPPQQYFSRWPELLDAKWLLILDGADEIDVTRMPEAITWLTQLWNRDLGILVSSRDSGDLYSWLLAQPTTHRLTIEFRSEQRLALARKLLNDKAETFIEQYDAVNLATVADTPLFVTLASSLYIDQGQLPAARTELLRGVLDLLLREMTLRARSEPIYPDLLGAARAVSQTLAVFMSRHPADSSLPKLQATIADALVALVQRPIEFIESSQYAQELLAFLTRHSGIMGRVGELIVWTHAVFREYLCAYALKDIDPRELSVKWLHDNQADASVQEIIEHLLELSTKYREAWILKLSQPTTHERVLRRVAYFVARNPTCTPASIVAVLEEVHSRVLRQRDGGICSMLLSSSVVWSDVAERMFAAPHIRALPQRESFIQQLTDATCDDLASRERKSDSILLYALHKAGGEEALERSLRRPNLPLKTRLAILHEMTAPPADISHSVITEVLSSVPVDPALLQSALKVASGEMLEGLLPALAQVETFPEVAKEVFATERFRDRLERWSQDQTLPTEIRLQALVAMACAVHDSLEARATALDRLNAFVMSTTWGTLRSSSLAAAVDVLEESDAHRSQLIEWLQSIPRDTEAHWLRAIDVLEWYLHFAIDAAIHSAPGSTVRRKALLHLAHRCIPSFLAEIESERMREVRECAHGLLGEDLSPADAAALHALIGVLLTHEGHHEEAKHELQRALQLHAGRWHAQYAYALKAQQRYSEALEILATLSQKGDLPYWAAMEKAGCHVQLSQFHEAARTLMEVPASVLTPHAWLLLGYSLAYEQTVAELHSALTYMGFAIERAPSNAGWRALRCATSLRASRLENVAEDIEHMDCEADPWQAFVAAIGRFAIGKQESAIEQTGEILLSSAWGAVVAMLRLLNGDDLRIPEVHFETDTDEFAKATNYMLRALLSYLKGEIGEADYCATLKSEEDLASEVVFTVLPLLSIAGTSAAAAANSEFQLRCAQLYGRLEREYILRPQPEQSRRLDDLRPVYCPLKSIPRLEPEHERAKRILEKERPRGKALVLLEVEGTEFLFGLCNFPRERTDKYDFKFVERQSTIEAENLALIVRQFGVTTLLVTSEALETEMRDTLRRHRLYCSCKRVEEPEQDEPAPDTPRSALEH